MDDQPISRDETAFSLDAATGAPFAPSGEITRATIAMKALDLGHVDESGYDQLLTDDEVFSTYLNSDQIAEHDPTVVEAAPDVGPDPKEAVYSALAAEAAEAGNSPAGASV